MSTKEKKWTLYNMAISTTANNTYTAANSSDVTPRTLQSAAKRLLKRGQAILVTEKFGSFDPQPRGTGLTRVWRRYHSLAVATTPLTEGTAPAGKRLVKTDVQVSLKQYGDWMELTDQIKDFHEDPILMTMMDLVGEQAAETIETLRIETLNGATNVRYAGGVIRRHLISTGIGLNDFNAVYRAFKANRCREISEVLKAGVNIATEPVRASYFAMGHTDLDKDIRALAGFIPAENYASGAKPMASEIGSIGAFRIILTEMFKPLVWDGVEAANGVAGQNPGDDTTAAAAAEAASDTTEHVGLATIATSSTGATGSFRDGQARARAEHFATEGFITVGDTTTTLVSAGAAPVAGVSSHADIYRLHCVGRDAYGIVPFAGKHAVKPQWQNPGKATTVDPLGQLGFVSWKTYQASVILNQAWIMNIECGATAL